MPESEESLNIIYQHRFDVAQRARKLAVWKVLCDRFFSRYITKQDVVLDVGAGFCEFINNVQAARRIAVDANPDLARFAAPGVETMCCRAENIASLPAECVDVAFTSNFLEHLSDKRTVEAVLVDVHRVLKPNGRLIVMGPNIRVLPGAYWDYFDHHIPLTERSLEEVLHLHGYKTLLSLPRFLPYTIKGRLPARPWLVRMYLAFSPITFRLWGRQFFVLAQKLDSQPHGRIANCF